jgi:pilus assembly protein Flp/PilA
MKKILYSIFGRLNAKRINGDEKGATMVEYGLLVALIAVACAAILTTLGTDLTGLFTTVDTKVTTAS